MSKQLLLVLFFISPLIGYSTHLRGGQIRVVSTNGLTCRIELRVLTNTASEILAGEGEFDFGDGTKAITETKDNTVLNPTLHLGFAVYSFIHVYAAPGTYILSYTEPNLSGGMINMFNSVETPFYIESGIVLSTTQSYSSPNFQTDPIFVCATQQTYAFSTAAIDDNAANDYFYKYAMVTSPKPISNYTVPENFVINENNGLMTWDTKYKGQYSVGDFWIVVKISKYSRLGDNLGYVLRAFQIVVDSGTPGTALTSSIADPNNKVVVVDGQEKKIKVFLSDVNPGNHFDIYYNKVLANNFSAIQYDSMGGLIRVAVLSLKTTPEILSDLPYPITLRGSSVNKMDITFLYMTKDIVSPPPVILGLSDKDELKIYPNPFRSELYLDGTTSHEVTFIDSFGQIVLRSGLHQGQPLNTTSLPSGVYVMQITDEDGVSRKIKVVRD